MFLGFVFQGACDGEKGLLNILTRRQSVGDDKIITISIFRLADYYKLCATEMRTQQRLK